VAVAPVKDMVVVDTVKAVMVVAPPFRRRPHMVVEPDMVADKATVVAVKDTAVVEAVTERQAAAISTIRADLIAVSAHWKRRIG